MTAGEPAKGNVVRRFVPQDAGPLHAINEASVPGVSSVSLAEFDGLIASAAVTFVACDTRHGGVPSRPLGFVLCMTEGLDYASLNYRCLSQRYDRFAYIDRVAIAQEGRGNGLGGALYRSVIDHFAGQRPVLLAEVNLAPPNPGSIRFHERFGFASVGERWSETRDKGVVYLARTLMPG